jgi:hypothetical protein
MVDRRIYGLTLRHCALNMLNCWYVTWKWPALQSSVLDFHLQLSSRYASHCLVTFEQPQCGKDEIVEHICCIDIWQVAFHRHAVGFSEWLTSVCVKEVVASCSRDWNRDHRIRRLTLTVLWSSWGPLVFIGNDKFRDTPWCWILWNNKGKCVELLGRIA